MLNNILGRYDDENFLKADGFDTAIIGVEESSMRLVYSVKKCIRILSKTMTREEAIEYFEFNIRGAYMGERTPIWCEDDF